MARPASPLFAFSSHMLYRQKVHKGRFLRRGGGFLCRARRFSERESVLAAGPVSPAGSASGRGISRRRVPEPLLV